MHLAYLFLIFFIWAYILKAIAEYLLFSKLHLIKLNFKNLNQLVLLNFCSLSFTLGIATATFIQNPANFIFISCLWVTIFTDTKAMLISRFVSLYLVPVGIILSWLNMTAITTFESMATAFTGAAIFTLINKIFFLFKKHDGLGQGDIELIAFIGSWIGALGTWFTITIGSTAGTVFTLLYMILTQKKVSYIPFGPFLALGAILFTLCSEYIMPLTAK